MKGLECKKIDKIALPDVTQSTSFNEIRASEKKKEIFILNYIFVMSLRWTNKYLEVQKISEK